MADGRAERIALSRLKTGVLAEFAERRQQAVDIVLFASRQAPAGLLIESCLSRRTS